MKISDICEWFVARFDLPMTGREFFNLSKTGELHHVFAAYDLYLEETREERARQDTAPTTPQP